MSQQEMVMVEKLVKVYPGGTRAVAGIDFTVAPGEFFGFLGPNGAGKTTTMKILSTLLKKTSGRVLVAGHDVDRDPDAVRQSIGFAMQEVGLDDLATGWDFLTLQGVLYRLSRKEARQRAAELLEMVGLADVAGRKVGTYSGGMRRRIDLVAALIHRPRLLFLDEPTSGLDPQARLALWEHLAQLNREGVTIFLTTQMMEEADRLCGRIAIIDRGEIVAQGSPSALKAEAGGDVIRVALDAASPGGNDGRLEEAAALLRGQSFVHAVSAEGSALAVRVRDGSADSPDVLRLLHQHGIAVSNLSVSAPTLDDVFLNYTGRNIRTEAATGDEVGQSLRPLLGLRRR